MKRAMFDIEANGLHDATQIHCLVLRDLDDPTNKLSCASDMGKSVPGYATLDEGLSILERAEYVSGHNVMDYDIPLLQRLHGLKVRGEVFDTLVACRVVWAHIEAIDHINVIRKNFPKHLIGSHSLEAWGVRLGLHKGDFGKNADWSRWTKPMQTYCENDVDVQVSLLDAVIRQKYAPSCLNLEHDFRRVIGKMEQIGWRFNTAAAGKLYAVMASEKQRITSELQAVVPPFRKETTLKTPAYYTGSTAFGPGQWRTRGEAKKAKASDVQPGPFKVKITETVFNPGSRVQVARFLTSKGIVLEKLTDSGSAAIDEVVLKGVDIPEARLLETFFLLNKRIGQLAEGQKGWLKLVTSAGRIHGRVNTNGAVTGRCTHSDPNISQVPGVKIGQDKKPKMGLDGGYGYECRDLFVVDDGMVLVGADASGLELRCMGHYLHPFDGGRFSQVVLTGDIHTENQKAFGLPEGKPGRDRSKTSIYAMCYGAGDEKLGASLEFLDPIHESEAQKLKVPDRVLENMIKKGPITPARISDWKRGCYARKRVQTGIVGFGQLIEKVKSTMKERGFLVGLDGRRLVCRSAHSALNTLFQSAGAVIMKKATVLCDNYLVKEGWGEKEFQSLLGHIHDEMQRQALVAIAEQVGRMSVQSIRDAGVALNFRCQLDGEFKIGKTWAETH